MTQENPRNYYRDYVTPEAWAELRRWLVASVENAKKGEFKIQAELLSSVLSKADELVAPVPRVVPAREPRVELGVNLGGVFISETVLGELLERGTRNSEVSGEPTILLDRNVGEALAKYGLAFRQTRGGWRATELLEAFMSKYDQTEKEAAQDE